MSGNTFSFHTVLIVVCSAAFRPQTESNLQPLPLLSVCLLFFLGFLFLQALCATSLFCTAALIHPLIRLLSSSIPSVCQPHCINLKTLN